VVNIHETLNVSYKERYSVASSSSTADSYGALFFVFAISKDISHKLSEDPFNSQKAPTHKNEK